MPRSVSIVGTGSYHPSRVMTNAELEKIVETSDEWIVSRTGIHERRIAAEGELSSDMGAQAARKALTDADISPEEIDLIIVATSTPDYSYPSTACLLQHKIGAVRAAAFDLQAACSGFIFALVTAQQFVASSMYQTVLVVGAERNSTIINWKDRNTCVLFGDGAGAVILRHKPGAVGVVASDLGADGAQARLLSVQGSGCCLPANAEESHPHIAMVGKEVYRHAVQRMGASAERVMAAAGWNKADIKLLIPHQANLRIIEALAQRFEVGMDRVMINLDRYGNTSAACIPVALDEAARAGRIQRGDKLLFVAFGGGFTWASVALEW